MPTQQLHLFVPAKPLLQRFGAEFFRAVPPKPGIYIMGGDIDRVLYIGQSKNLRRRLGTYKNARPDRVPQKVIRLIHSVRTIVWEECPTAEAARERENQLLRTHRPKFNVQNTYPPAYRFIATKYDASGLILHLAAEPTSAAKNYGVFESGCVRAYGTLLRLIWAAFHQPASPYDFPRPLLASEPPLKYLFGHGQHPSPEDLEHWSKGVEEFLAGDSDELIQTLSQRLPDGEGISPFQRSMQGNDLEVLADFFNRGPKRNRDLRMRFEIAAEIIEQGTEN